MAEETLIIPTPDGTANGYAYRPAGAGPWPAALFFMDGIGIRPALRAMAERLASNGYYVLLPNLYYRAGPVENMDLVKDWDRFMGYVAEVLQGDGVRRDIGACLDFLGRSKDVKGEKVVCTGYCMGGHVSLVAAGAYGARIGAAASIHGGRLASDDPNSPHRGAHTMRARLYVGVAEIDSYLEPGETDRLKGALEGSALSHSIEIYPGVEHGFAVPGLPVYDKPASERHWDRILGLFKAAL
jgi:carboxymethylenebutenolidase